MSFIKSIISKAHTDNMAKITVLFIDSIIRFDQKSPSDEKPAQMLIELMQIIHDLKKLGQLVFIVTKNMTLLLEKNFTVQNITIGKDRLIEQIIGPKTDKDTHNPPLVCDKNIEGMIGSLMEKVCRLKNDGERNDALWSVQTVIILENLAQDYRIPKDNIILFSNANHAITYALEAKFNMAFDTPTFGHINGVIESILTEKKQLIRQIERAVVISLDEQIQPQKQEEKDQEQEIKEIQYIRHIYAPIPSLIPQHNKVLQKQDCPHGYNCWNLNRLHLKKMRHFRTRNFKCSACESTGFTSYIQEDGSVRLFCNNNECKGDNTYRIS